MARVDTKSVLLVRLLGALDEGCYSFDGLRERIAQDGALPSPRSLRRYLSVLGDANFPWFYDRARGVYRFVDGYSLRALKLDRGEIFGLVALRSLAKSLGGSVGAAVDTLARRVVASGAGQATELHDLPFGMPLPHAQLDERTESVREVLAAAERDRRVVAIEYVDRHGKSSTRDIEPYGLIVAGGRYYCVGYDRMRRARRTFALDGMESARLTSRTYQRPAEFDLEKWMSSSISGLMTGEAAHEVTVRFDPRIAKAAVAASSRLDRDLTKNTDGSVELRLRVADLDELLRWVLGWGSEARLVGPESAVLGMRRLLSEIGRYYDGTPDMR